MDSQSAERLWVDVFRLIEVGIVVQETVYRQLLGELARLYPGDDAVSELRAKYLPPSTPATTQPPPTQAPPARAQPEPPAGQRPRGSPTGETTVPSQRADSPVAQTPAGPSPDLSTRPGQYTGKVPRRRRGFGGLVPVVAGVMAVAVAMAGGWLIVRAVRGEGGASSCTAPKDSTSALQWHDGECVGYSDGTFAFGEAGDDHTDRSVDDLVAVQHLIGRQNACADDLRRRSPPSGRPFITLVYFAGLSASGDTGGNWAAAQVAELEGLLTWQRHQNIVAHNPPDPSCQPAPADTSPPNSREYLGESTEQGGPIVRVVVANGGSKMRLAGQVGRLLVDFARRPDEHVASVIGLDRTLPSTKQAITDLGKAGIITIATTLSGDNLAQLSPSYFQLVPQNTREALVATRYAAWTGRSQIEVYFPNQDCSDSSTPPTDDDYIQSLVFDTQAAAGVTSVQGKPLQVTLHGWKRTGTCESPGDLQAYFARECARLGGAGSSGGRNRLVFYAGRQEDFGDFRTGMASCLDTVAGPSPNGVLVLGDDAVIRYVTQMGGYESGHVIFRLISKGPAPTLAGASCANGELARTIDAGRFPFQLDSDLPELCTRLNAMFTFTTGTPPAASDGSAPPTGATGPSSAIAASAGSPRLSRPVTQWVDERIALAYDAARLTLNAVCRTVDDLNATCQPERTDLVDANALRAWILRTPQSGTTGRVDFASDRAADGKQLAVLRVDLGLQALPDARWPPPPVTEVETDPRSTCKLVLSGTPPRATDCLGRALPAPTG
ncbi:hypothetical protein MXD95_023550 [Frankia sp. AiPa1]|nr:hypothetical protein [Frankia sp. AiPa1]